MLPTSLFRLAYERTENRLHQGFEYKNVILKKTMSNQMFGINPIFDEFLKRINDIWFETIENVKQIKVFANPALDKFERKIN